MKTNSKAKNFISVVFSFASSFVVSAIAICAACAIGDICAKRREKQASEDEEQLAK